MSGRRPRALPLNFPKRYERCFIPYHWPQWYCQMNEKEREAFIGYASEGFHLKPSPAPHELQAFLTNDEHLFETIHMGAPRVDESKWILVIDGLVRKPLRLTPAELKELPVKEIVSFHECYGSPLNPATSGVHRVGNVKWTGVPLPALLDMVDVDEDARFIWSDGLDRGSYGGRTMDRYQKDLPLDKARSDDVLIAYAMNDRPLSVNRGGPVRLVVPGFFGTNSTKWLCKLSAQSERPPGPFTTVWYNETLRHDGAEVVRPVWEVTPHSIITAPSDNAVLPLGRTTLRGWAWAAQAVDKVEISIDNGQSWMEAELTQRKQYEWQSFQVALHLCVGNTTIMCRASDINGLTQPLGEARNEVHRINIAVR